jgi:hypothetical protein
MPLFAPATVPRSPTWKVAEVFGGMVVVVVVRLTVIAFTVIAAGLAAPVTVKLAL